MGQDVQVIAFTGNIGDFGRDHDVGNLFLPEEARQPFGVEAARHQHARRGPFFGHFGQQVGDQGVVSADGVGAEIFKRFQRLDREGGEFGHRGVQGGQAVPQGQNLVAALFVRQPVGHGHFVPEHFFQKRQVPGDVHQGGFIGGFGQGVLGGDFQLIQFSDELVAADFFGQQDVGDVTGKLAEIVQPDFIVGANLAQVPMVVAVAHPARAVVDASGDQVLERRLRQPSNQDFHQALALGFHGFEVEVLLPIQGVQQQPDVGNVQARVPAPGGFDQGANVIAQFFPLGFVGFEMPVKAFEALGEGFFLFLFGGGPQGGQGGQKGGFRFESGFKGFDVPFVEGGIFRAVKGRGLREGEAGVFGPGDQSFD